MVYLLLWLLSMYDVGKEVFSNFCLPCWIILKMWLFLLEDIILPCKSLNLHGTGRNCNQWSETSGACVNGRTAGTWSPNPSCWGSTSIHPSVVSITYIEELHLLINICHTEHHLFADNIFEIVILMRGQTWNWIKPSEKHPATIAQLKLVYINRLRFCVNPKSFQEINP